MPSGAEEAGEAGTTPAGHVVLLGMMGAGKTTTGLALADRLGWPFVDSDTEVEARAGVPGAAVAAHEGVAALHALEATILCEALSLPEPVVVAAAASVVDSRPCRAALARAGLVVWLHAPLDELERRAVSGVHRRPLPTRAAALLLRRRWRRFARAADLRLDGTRPTAALVDAIAHTLARGQP